MIHSLLTANTMARETETTFRSPAHEINHTNQLCPGITLEVKYFLQRRAG